MANLAKSKNNGRWLLAVMFAALLAVILLMADATQNISHFSRLHQWLLPINSVLLLIFVGLIAFNMARLIKQVKRKAPGSRLTLRLLMLFVVLAIMPVVIVYTFSIWLLERGVDSWFDVKVEQALEDAVDLSRASLDLRTRTLSKQAEPLVDEFIDVESFNATLLINDLLGTTGATEIALFDGNNRIIASGGLETTTEVVPQLPGESVLQLIRQGEKYIALEPVGEGELQIRMVFPVPSNESRTDIRMLQFLYPVSGRISSLAEEVQAAFGYYNELIYLRTPLKQNFILILTLVLALGVLFAVFAAFYWSQVLVAPIRDLVQGTKAVAAGQYHQRIPVTQKDDLGLLVVSFNRMTERLGVARDTTIINQRIIENQRTYLQTILEHLSSGVLSLDESFVLKTCNAVSSQILQVNMTQFIGKQFMQVGVSHDYLKEFCISATNKLKQTSDEWQIELEIFTSQGRKSILCKSVKLPSDDESRRGYVLVFDDVTALLQAERDSAWGEVARRLAHEIKNPLTPIQLSAERLQRKLLPALEEEHSTIVKRATDTIVQQVESMKLMVNDFSDYARMPVMEPTPVDINSLVMNTVELYRGDHQRVNIKLELEQRTMNVRGDSVRLRQVIHNLIKNAIEAMPNEKVCKIAITSFTFEYANTKYAGMQLVDNGPGFSNEVLDHVFEPYMTTKKKGNGLGLAIVKKIIEEHNGSIKAENKKGGGAIINIKLPLYELGEQTLAVSSLTK